MRSIFHIIFSLFVTEVVLKETDTFHFQLYVKYRLYLIDTKQNLILQTNIDVDLQYRIYSKHVY
jgi:hypothetical protein